MYKFPLFPPNLHVNLLGLAPLHLPELCCPLDSAMSSRSLRSSQQGLLLVPFARTSAKQRRAFSVVGPSIWNWLPSQLRTLPIEPCHLRFFLNLRLLFLAVLESGAPLSSSLEEALYKCSVWMNEWICFPTFPQNLRFLFLPILAMTHLCIKHHT